MYQYKINECCYFIATLRIIIAPNFVLIVLRESSQQNLAISMGGRARSLLLITAICFLAYTNSVNRNH